MDKRFIVILVVVILGLAGIFILGKSKSNTSSSSSTSSATGSTSNHTKGAGAKNVNITVYGDFQCPVCSQYYPIEKAVIEKYQNDITFTFRHFPLESIHPNARGGARAAEAAGLQGKFFEMHDLLYENQQSWSTGSDPMPYFTNYATQLGLNIDKFKTDFASEAVNSTINADLKEGNGKAVSGTPTYFFNGKKMDNTELNSFDKFSAKVQEAINNAGK
jgi:protein-disulfide isomerase